MKPYWEGRGARLFLGDCREVLPTLGRDSVDLIVTDPPYGIAFTSGRRNERFAVLEGDDGSLDVSAALGLALKALRNHRHVYVFGPACLSALPLACPVGLIWDQGGSAALGNMALPWGTTHESITFAVHVRSKANRARGDGGLAARLRRGSVLRFPRLNSRAVSDHPTEKPVPLLRMLIESSSLLGETVLDPFTGVGSTLVAAVLEGRNAVGIEIDEGYCERAAKRLDALPLPLLEIGA